MAINKGKTMIPAIIIFIITYLLLLIFPKYRTYIALISALIFIILNYLTFQEAFGYLDFNVLMMILGTMGLVVLFIESTTFFVLGKMDNKSALNTTR